ncbi:ExbD/TolR family protein, partial [Leisingera sp. ANG-DT]|uniref:ExbD/TolR family protein n=1 Tax=Leisingera sp. ANG-DT TaxID=1577897 RepID=UPI00057C5F11
LAVSASGDLALDGKAIARDALSPALSALLADDPALRLRINAHRTAELRNVLPLVAQGEALGFTDVVLVVTPETGG